MTNPCQGHAAESARAEKPEALRLADWLESEDMPTEEASCAEAAAELRRLHALCDEMAGALKDAEEYLRNCANSPVMANRVGAVLAKWEASK